MKTKITGVVLFAIVITTALCLAGCGKSQTYSVGETVETDVVSFTLDRAELAVALNSSMGFGARQAPDGLAGGDYFLPKEYDALDDSENAFVAAKGHTFVSLTFTARNLDRASVKVFDKPSDEISITYNGEVFTGNSIASEDGKVRIEAENVDGAGWKPRDVVGSHLPLAGILLLPNSEASYKACIDIPVEIENLDSPFEIAFYLPKSDGERQPFTFSVN